MWIGTQSFHQVGPRITSKTNLDLAKSLARADLIVIAMDEQATPIRAMNKGRQAFASCSQTQFDKPVRKLNPPDAQQRSANVETAMIIATTKALICSAGVFLWVPPGMPDLEA